MMMNGQNWRRFILWAKTASAHVLKILAIACLTKVRKSL